ncbi:MAG TPA: hypothetical protein VII03_01135 [Solirubrobacteraceae bacterium]
MSQRPVTDEAELIEFIRSIDEPAPERLHRRTEALIAHHAQAPRGGTRALRLRLGAVTALAGVATLVAVLVLNAAPGGSGSLSLQSATALTLRPSTSSAPRESSSRRAQLTAAVDGVSFPYWGERFGWRATGSRSDRLGGRDVRTVFYTDNGGQRIGYAIVAGTPAPRVAAGRPSWRAGTAYRLSSVDGTRVVTWVRSGHLCVVAGHGVSGATLLRLASWDDRGAPA